MIRFCKYTMFRMVQPKFLHRCFINVHWLSISILSVVSLKSVLDAKQFIKISPKSKKVSAIKIHSLWSHRSFKHLSVLSILSASTAPWYKRRLLSSFCDVIYWKVSTIKKCLPYTHCLSCLLLQKINTFCNMFTQEVKKKCLSKGATVKSKILQSLFPGKTPKNTCQKAKLCLY